MVLTCGCLMMSGDSGLQAAMAVASATMTPVNAEASPHKLVELVSKVSASMTYFLNTFGQLFKLASFFLHNEFIVFVCCFNCRCILY